MPKTCHILTCSTSYVLLTVHIGIIFVNNQFDAQFFSCMFISILYVFRAAMCPSSGELIVSIWHLVYVTLYRWPFGVSILYMFWAAMCPSSGELIVSIRHLVYVTLYRWPFSVSILYMFRAAMCPSSGELIVSTRHLVYVILYRWPFGVQVWMRLQSRPNLHTKRSSIQSDIYQMSYWYN